MSVDRNNPSPSEVCEGSIKALLACKADLGLGLREPYKSGSYLGECDEAEFSLKRCMAFAVDPLNARILYDPNQQRSRRVQANSELQKKLAKHSHMA